MGGDGDLYRADFVVATELIARAEDKEDVLEGLPLEVADEGAGLPLRKDAVGQGVGGVGVEREMGEGREERRGEREKGVGVARYGRGDRE